MKKQYQKMNKEQKSETTKLHETNKSTKATK